MRHRLLAALLTVGTATAVLLSGCATARAPQGGWEDSGEITYWMWDASQLPAYQQCATDFETANPDVQVKVEQLGWDDYWGRLFTSFVSDSAPDVFVDHSSRYGQFADRGLLEPLDGLVERDGPDLGQYVRGTADVWVGADGRRYGLPKDVDAVGIYYNRTMAGEAGITPDRMQRLTWNPADGGDYERVIARLTVDRNGVRGDEPGFDRTQVATYGLGLESSGDGAAGQTQWAMYAAATGWRHTDRPMWGSRFHFDDPRLQDTIRWWRGLIEKGYMPPLETTVGGSVDQQLQAGRYAMITYGSWNLKDVSELGGVQLATAPTPIGPAGRVTTSNSLGDSISAGSPRKGAAWRWVRYLASPQCQSVVARGGVVLPAIAAELPEAEATLARTGLDPRAFTGPITRGETTLRPVMSNSAQVDDVVTTAFDQIMTFRADPGSLTAMNDRVTELIRRPDAP